MTNIATTKPLDSSSVVPVGSMSDPYYIDEATFHHIKEITTQLEKTRSVPTSHHVITHETPKKEQEQCSPICNVICTIFLLPFALVAYIFRILFYDIPKAVGSCFIRLINTCAHQEDNFALVVEQ